MTNETKNTENRLKNLKEGDPVYVRSSFDSRDANGNILTTHYYVLSKGKQIKLHTCSSPENILLPSELQTPAPKYDPCRPFKRGDVVEPCKCQGREAWGMNQEETTVLIPSGRHTVLHESCSQVEIQAANGDIFFISPCFLKLITPVEELEPYTVEESCGGANLRCFMLKREKKHLSYYLYKEGNANHYYTREEAKAAAETECKRLNDEYRKEQK